MRAGHPASQVSRLLTAGPVWVPVHQGRRLTELLGVVDNEGEAGRDLEGTLLH